MTIIKLKQLNISSEIYTLSIDNISDINLTENDIDKNKIYTKIHNSGWTISANLDADYYVWIDYFTASHSEFGKIIGNLKENEIITDSEEGYTHFINNHKIETFDLYDI